MNPCLKTSKGRNKINYWNNLDSLMRFKLIIKYKDLFLSHNLITNSELTLAGRMSKAEQAYVIGREDCPIFKKLNIKKEVETQSNRDKLNQVLTLII